MEAGERFAMLEREANGVTIADLVRVYAFEKGDVEMIQRLVELPALSEAWRKYFQEQLARQRIAKRISG